MDQAGIHVPSKSRLAKATLIALLAALVLLFTVVLPAEYGFDPLKTGAALRLTGIAKSEAASPQGAAPVPVTTGVYTPQAKIYKVDSQDFVLTPGDAMEMKYHLEKGATMVYAWKANGVLEYEFHGMPDDKPNPDYYQSYDLNKKGKSSFYGSLIAPTTGLHGWFWRNNSNKPIEFHLTAAGFFDSAKMYAGGPPEDMPVEDVK
jgi:hypothetical protein